MTLTLLATSPRIAPGLLSRDAWEAIALAAQADSLWARPIAADGDDPLALAMLEAGYQVNRAEGAMPQVAAQLIEHAEKTPTLWLGSTDGDPGLTDAIATHMAALAAQPEREAPAVEVLVGSWDTPGARVLDAMAVMDRLRSPAGCAWVAHQTHGSLVPYLAEEADEASAAIASGIREQTIDELGDVLLQVLFHSRIGQEHPEHPWSVDDVAAALTAKLVRRHPHVFGDSPARTLEEISAQWQRIKLEEKRSEDLGAPPTYLHTEQ